MKFRELTRFFNIYSIFALALFIRFFFSLDKGNAGGSDEQRYILLSNQILVGNFDLDAGCFICAPFFPYFLAGLKLITGNYWYESLIIFHIFISSLCVFCIYKIGIMLFEKSEIALTASLIYAIYPDTFRFIRCIGQDVLFQAFLLFSIYFLLMFIKNKRLSNIILSSSFFSLCFLTKSLILLWSPFIIFYIFLCPIISTRAKFQSSLIYIFICVIFTIPIGYYNLLKHNEYTLSSNGGSAMLWYGNSEFAYQRNLLKKYYEIELPNQALNDTSYQIMETSLSKINTETYTKARKTWGTPREIQNRFWQTSVQWIKENPKKFWQLHGYYIFRFLAPGQKPPNASTTLLFLIFLYSSIFYFTGLIGLYICVRKNWKKHLLLITLYSTIFLFSIVFGTQVRFRIIIVDSFLCLYVAYFLHYFYKKINPIIYSIPIKLHT